MRNRRIRRHNSILKAIRKRRIVREVYLFKDWYDNLHQYSKNKIHCSCPLCRSKTNDQSVCGPAMNWPIRDRKVFDSMDLQLMEFENDISSR